jgi:hypothetical protein
LVPCRGEVQDGEAAKAEREVVPLAYYAREVLDRREPEFGAGVVTARERCPAGSCVHQQVAFVVGTAVAQRSYRLSQGIEIDLLPISVPDAVYAAHNAI